MAARDEYMWADSWRSRLFRYGKRFIKKGKVFEHNGWCPICEASVTFSADRAWFRDHLVCSGCGSIPRERALFKVITEYFPNYRELAIHESSPSGRGASVIAPFVMEIAKMPTVIIMIDNIELGIRAEYIDVLVSSKP